MRSSGGPEPGEERPKNGAAESTGDIGEVIGGYRLEQCLGAGGMGRVFSARHVRLNRPAAVKIIRARFADDEEMLQRFYREAKIVSDIRHPNIVDVFDFLEIENPRRVACIMEYLEGPSLKALLSKRKLRPIQATNLTLQLADALRTVHEIGVIHRDIKPANVVVIGSLDSDLAVVPSVKLLDFGIAKVSEGEDVNLTRTGAMLGTPRYMAPEQIGGGTLTPKADVYALGELLYEMIGGAPVFPGEAVVVFRQKLSGKPPELRLPVFPASEEVLALVARCISHDAKDRPSTLEFFDALRECRRLLEADDPEAQTRSASGREPREGREGREDRSRRRSGEASGSQRVADPNGASSRLDATVAKLSPAPGGESEVETKTKTEVGESGAPRTSSSNAGRKRPTSPGVSPGPGRPQKLDDSLAVAQLPVLEVAPKLDDSSLAGGAGLPAAALSDPALARASTTPPPVPPLNGPSPRNASSPSNAGVVVRAAAPGSASNPGVIVRSPAPPLPPGTASNPGAIVRSSMPPGSSGISNPGTITPAAPLSERSRPPSGEPRAPFDTTAHGATPEPEAPSSRSRVLWPVVFGMVLAVGASVAVFQDQITDAVQGAIPSHDGTPVVEPPPTQAPPPAINPLTAQLAEWTQRLGKPTGTPEQHLKEARQHFYADRWKEYGLAEQSINRALILQPENAQALAFYVENLAIWKGPSLTDEELELIKKVLQFADDLDPASLAVARAKAAVSLARHDLETCFRLASLVADRAHDDPLARLWVAAALVDGDTDRSIREAEAAISVEPQLRRRDLVVARSQANAGHYATAMKILRERLKKDPTSGSATMLLGDLERELGHLDAAVGEYRQAVQLPGDQRAARIGLGELLLRTGAYGQAEENFRAVAHDHEACVSYRLKASVGLGRAAFALGQLDRANPAVDQALSLDSHDAAARLLKAELAFVSKDLPRAEGIARDVLSSLPGEPAVLVLLGRLALARGEGDNAVRLGADALHGNPHDAEVRAVLAGFYLSFGAKAQAIDVIEEAAKLDPLERVDDPRRIYFGLAPAALNEAVARLKDAAGDRDAKAAANAALALVGVQEGKVAQARRDLAVALKANPNATLAMVQEAELALEQGDLGRGESLVAKLLVKDQHSGIAHLIRSRLYSKRRSLLDAKLERGLAGRLDPSLFLVNVESAAAALAQGETGKVETLVKLMKERPNVVATKQALYDAKY